ncbi:hypothetical protein GCM10027030_24910 [Luteococcus sediminum]
MKITTLVSIGVVVADLEKAVENYARLLGITQWAVHERGAGQLSEMVSHGRRSDGTYRSAFGAAPFDPEGPGPMGAQPRPTPFELVQPTGGESPFNEFLLSRGEGICFLTVIAEDDEQAIEAHLRNEGIEKFDIKTWQTGFGRLDKPFYRDQDPVQHGYFTAQGFAGDFGFEIIQCKYGDSHYNREFTDQRGPGIHHMFPFLTTDEGQWEQVAEDMTALGCPVVMGSDPRGGASAYCYYDTFGPLSGFLVEGVWRHFPAKDEYMAPDWTVDYSTLEQR